MTTSPHPRVLVVEDNVDTQMLLHHLLRRSYDATILSGIDEALGAVEKETFDLFLIDINLGEQRTGVDLLKRLRQHDDAADVPALALTAYALPGDGQRFLDVGFDGYISKPFTRETLYDSIAEALGRSDVSSS